MVPVKEKHERVGAFAERDRVPDDAIESRGKGNCRNGLIANVVSLVGDGQRSNWLGHAAVDFTRDGDDSVENNRLRKSAFGEPTAYRVRGTLIALRKEQSDLILMEKNGDLR